jgi:hypothetical protein
MRTIFLVAAMTVIGVSAQTPVEIDRTLQRVNGTSIMTSDVRQARLLRLINPPPGSDDAILAALENRLLMLSEAVRAAVAEPAAAQIAARRQSWAASWPSASELAGQIQRAGMSDRALDGWFRDEFRIETYLEQRFPPDPKRDERIAAWIRDLRTRANLPIKIGSAG